MVTRNSKSDLPLSKNSLQSRHYTCLITLISFSKLVSYKRLVTKAGFAEYVTITLESGFNDLDDSWSPDDSKTNQLSTCHEKLVQIQICK